MAIDNFIPEIWSTNLLVNFRKDFVFSSLVNRDYEGEVSEFGDIVKVQTPNSIPVAVTSEPIFYSTPTSATQNVVIDQDYTYAFRVNDLDRVQANVNLTNPFITEGANSMADRVDSDIASLYVDGTAGDIAFTLASDDLYDALVDAGKNLSENNVPTNGRWAVVSAAGYASLLKNDKFIHATQQGDSVIRNASIGRCAGFDIYMSNNTQLATTQKYMYGHPSAITWAGQLMRAEANRDKDAWGDYFRNRLVWGRKVVRPPALGTISATE